MAEEVIELPGARLLELAKQNGVLEESIRRNQKQIDENTRKAQELEKKIAELDLEYHQLQRQVDDLDGMVHKGTQTAKPLTTQVTEIRTEFDAQKKLLQFIAVTSTGALIELIFTLVRFFTKGG